ncbi:hypothetical protein SK128_014836, partial [Halocaridina rubra]
MCNIPLTVQFYYSSAISLDELDPDFLLEDLSPEELDELLEDVLLDIETQILAIYERHLQNYHERMKEMAKYTRSRREVTSSLSSMPVFEEDFWHSEIGEIKLDNREILRIDSITVRHTLGDVQIEKVFPLGLWNLPAVYVNDHGVAMIVKDRKLVPVTVRNAYTLSLKGCLCGDSITMECACCIPGACLCTEVDSYFGNVCLPCGQHNDVKACASASPHVLETNAVTGFQYSLDDDKSVEGIQSVVISASETTLSFYKYDEEGLRPLAFENGMTTISFSKPVTHLGFADTYTDIHGSLQRRRFLVTFTADEKDHQFHGLDVGSRLLKTGLSQMWHASGQNMKVWSSGGRIMVGVLNETELLIHEMKEDHLHEYHMMLIQKIGRDEQILSFKSISMNFEDFIMMVTPSYVRIYHKNGIYYNYTQDLQLTDGLASFWDMCYFSIPSYRDKGVFLTGDGTTLIAYVWNGTSQKIEKIYTTSLRIPLTNHSVFHAHEEETDTGPQVVFSGTVRPVTLDINATLEELPDPVNLQTKALHEKIQELEDEFIRQNAIIEKFLDRVNNSVDGRSEITGPIVVRDGIFVEG